MREIPMEMDSMLSIFCAAVKESRVLDKNWKARIVGTCFTDNLSHKLEPFNLHPTTEVS